MRSALLTALLMVLLVAGGYAFKWYRDEQERDRLRDTQLDSIVVTLRQKRNRLEVQKLSGAVTTKRIVYGGPGDVLRGEMTIKQPWSVSYFVDMSRISLSDYIWDTASRTLTVRAPSVIVDPPNVDESRQTVAVNGWFITRDMQSRLRSAIAIGARRQVVAEAAKPENMAAATRAAQEAIAHNLETSLEGIPGLGDVTVEVRTPANEQARNRERWDVSRSIPEVLKERASR